MVRKGTSKVNFMQKVQQNQASQKKKQLDEMKQMLRLQIQ